jgi:N-acetylglucosamine kinase-like BadF-type ATPase
VLPTAVRLVKQVTAVRSTAGAEKQMITAMLAASPISENAKRQANRVVLSLQMEPVEVQADTFVAVITAVQSTAGAVHQTPTVVVGATRSSVSV